jgi:hypothetical protein
MKILNLKIFAILILALGFRWLGPFLHQSAGDSLYYTAVAMKLKTQGLAGYNFRGIGINKTDPPTFKSPFLELRESESDGDVVAYFRSQHLDYYIQPVHFMPYGFPYLLSSTHLSNDWKLVNVSVHPMDLWSKAPLDFLKAQAGLLFPSLIASLLLVYLIYRYATSLFGETAGLWSAFLFATYPIDILTSQHIWTDDILTLGCISSVLIWQKAKSKNSVFLSFLSGICLGAGFLMKQTALFFGFAMVVSEIFEFWKSRTRFPVKLLIPFLMAILLITIHWFGMMWYQYHDPLFVPFFIKTSTEIDFWHAWLAKRHHAGILFTLGIFILSPAVHCCWLKLNHPHVRPLLITSLVFIAIFTVMDLREYRYILPVIPLMILAAGSVLKDYSIRFKSLMISFAVLQVIWSGWLTYRYVWQAWGEIPIPF